MGGSAEARSGVTKRNGERDESNGRNGERNKERKDKVERVPTVGEGSSVWVDSNKTKIGCSRRLTLQLHRMYYFDVKDVGDWRGCKARMVLNERRS